MVSTSRLEVAREALGRTRWRSVDEAALADGDASFRIERVALTANNVTYGAFGETLGYWRFYPSDDPAWGLVPAWGFATVDASRAAGVEPGSRWWGFWPIADRATLHPAKGDGRSFLDGAAHRRDLATVYNRYLRAEPRGDDALVALFRPLFTTSFLLDDFLADADWFGADQVLLSSASSKTAWGLAWCLAERRRQAGKVRVPRVVGATSAGNLDFVRSLGVFDAAIDYASLASLDAAVPTAFVDMRGSADFRASVHRHWADRLVASSAVGAAEWRSLGSGRGLPGAEPVLFFAPAQAAARIADWGQADFESRVETASTRFLAHVAPHATAGDPRLRVVEVQGPDAIGSTWHALVDGTVPPGEGRIAVLAAEAG